jgi:hypothetical protein
MWRRVRVADYRLQGGSGPLQVDRSGGPGINIGFNQGEDMQSYNLLEPAQDRGHFFDRFVTDYLTDLPYPGLPN